MCNVWKETIKHLLCSCKHEEIRNITARHDKVVKELALWGDIAQRKHKITSVEVNPKLQTDTVKKPDLLFTYTKDNKVHETFVEITISMDNPTKRARDKKFEKYRKGVKDHQEANPEVKVQYKTFAFGVSGAIPEKLESIMAGITPKAKTDWLVTQIHRALLVHNTAISIARDRKYNKTQCQELGGDTLDEELQEPMDIDC